MDNSRILLVGNCLVYPLAEVIRAALPGQTVTPITFPEFANPAINYEELIQSHTAIFAQHGVPEAVWSHFAPNASRIMFFPRVTYPAFHPDIVYAQNAHGNMLKSPLDDYNSSLVLFGWTQGWTADRIEALFTPETYRRLGFDQYREASRTALLAEGELCGFDMDRLLQEWLSTGQFMYTINHSRNVVSFAIARELFKKNNWIWPKNLEVGSIYDPLSNGALWPVYPGLAESLGVQGSFEFVTPTHDPHAVRTRLTLRGFIDGSLELYSRDDPQGLQCDRVHSQLFGCVLNEFGQSAVPASRSADNPYRGLPKHQFWTSAIANVDPSNVDPVVTAPFRISQHDRIATAGSCFAQHIARNLSKSGYSYLVTEAAPDKMTPEISAKRQFGVYSARYGNVYTARQMVQLFDRSFLCFDPMDKAWIRPDGRYIDPFRPEIEPEGFASEADVIEARQVHFAAVRTMFETADCLVFTLGLTEGWRSRIDGAMFPLAPGVRAGRMDSDAYEFVNFRVAEVTADLEAFLARLGSVNPACRVILTVSPVPLMATYEPRHVLTSTTYSKAVLRVAAEEIAGVFSHVVYFPSYEVITGSFSRGAYYAANGRDVEQAGVEHVMRLFFRHFTATEAPSETARPALAEPVFDIAKEIGGTNSVICEESYLSAH